METKNELNLCVHLERMKKQRKMREKKLKQSNHNNYIEWKMPCTLLWAYYENCDYEG